MEKSFEENFKFSEKGFIGSKSLFKNYFARSQASLRYEHWKLNCFFEGSSTEECLVNILILRFLKNFFKTKFSESEPTSLFEIKQFEALNARFAVCENCWRQKLKNLLL